MRTGHFSEIPKLIHIYTQDTSAKIKLSHTLIQLRTYSKMYGDNANSTATEIIQLIQGVLGLNTDSSADEPHTLAELARDIILATGVAP